MSKLPFFLLSTLLASTSALASSLNCNKHPSCEEMGYSKADVPGCKDYLYCLYDHNYKVCLPDCGNTPAPNPTPDPTPEYDCDDMARKINNAATFYYYFTCENNDGTCIVNDANCSKRHQSNGDSTWLDPCLSTIAGVPSNQASTQQNCENMNIALKAAIQKHNEKCPPLDVNIHIYCDQCKIKGQASTCESYSEFLNPCRFDIFNVVSKNEKKTDPCYVYKACMDGKETKYEERQVDQVCTNAAGDITYQPLAGYTCFYCKKQ